MIKKQLTFFRIWLFSFLGSSALGLGLIWWALQTPLEKPLPEENTIPKKQEVPICILDREDQDSEEILPLRLVKKGSIEIPRSLHQWIVGEGSVTWPYDFAIQSREVTVGEFSQYFQSLSSQEQEKRGTSWKEEDLQHPVKRISWGMAKGYADWMAKKTGCDLDLPIEKEWKMAVLEFLPSPQSAVLYGVIREAEPITKVPMDRATNLLSGVREWTLDSCAEGRHYAVGETPGFPLNQLRGKPACLKIPSQSLGFRLVRRNLEREQKKDVEIKETK